MNRSPEELAARIKDRARELGFGLVGIAPAVVPAGLSFLQEWLERGYCGEMSYLPRRAEAYEHPDRVLEAVRSVVMLGMNYRADDPPSISPGEARVSRYAWGGRDYHDLLREKLKELAAVLHNDAPGCRTRGVVDTAPLLERDFARLAGLGWFGKNTMLLNKRLGSWFFLAALLTDMPLPADAPHETAHCGTCRRCLDACPTGAFPEPYVLDARRCISYLTIELRDRPIPEELQAGIGDWLFGCDICQEVCPWNRKAPRTDETAFIPRPDLHPANAIALLSLTPEEFDRRFVATPLERPGRGGLLRNAAIVLGNTARPTDVQAVAALVAALDDLDPLVRGAAAASLARIAPPEAEASLRSRRAVEDNAAVVIDLDSAIAVVSHYAVSLLTPDS